MIINSQDIECYNFYNDFVQCKKPVLIKDALSSNQLNQIIVDKKDKIKPLYTRGAAPFLYTYFNDISIRNYVFNLPLISHLADNSNTLFRKEMRLWCHSKNNVSYFHYDQRSTDLLNICLSGSKKWCFLPPDAPLKCWPFYNIALPFQKNKKEKSVTFIMEKGDIIYIPRNWFHQVTTLEDDTKNINVIFNDLTDKKMEKREKELASIKRLCIPNYVYGDNIAALNNAINKVPVVITLQRLFIELWPILVIIILVALMFNL